MTDETIHDTEDGFLQPIDPGDLASPYFNPWRIIRQPGTAYDGEGPEWEWVVPLLVARVTARGNDGALRSWIVTMTEEVPSPYPTPYVP